MRYFLSLLIFAIVAVFWNSLVTERVSRNWEGSFLVGLCGIFAVAMLGVAIARFVAKGVTGQDPHKPSDSDPPSDTEPKQNHSQLGDGPESQMKSGPAPPKRTTLLGNETPSELDWYVLHGGEQIGPFSLGELVENIMIGRIRADHLVKQGTGEWRPARDVPDLKDQFVS